MARIRSIKPEFFTSLTVASLPIETRLTFIGLWTHVDDEGRCVDDARLIKAAVWPLDDRLSTDVELDLKRLSESSLILRYKVGERSYLAVRGWGEHQRINRPTKSKLPPPPESPELPPTSGTTPLPPAETPGRSAPEPSHSEPSPQPHTQLTEDSLAERNREQGTGNRKKPFASPTAPPKTKRGTRLPDDFTVTEPMKEWFRINCPGINGPRETEKFCNHFRSAPGRKGVKLDWVATWRNWMLTAAERNNSPVTGRATGANRHLNHGRDDNPFRTGAASATYASHTPGAEQ